MSVLHAQHGATGHSHADHDRAHPLVDHHDAHPVVEDNSHAGQGAVLLDIGGDIGALVVITPESMVGVEVEIRPAGISEFPAGHHHTHVGVLARPVGDGVSYSAVYPELASGRYELHELPAGPVKLTVTVVGGAVTDARWPE